MSRAARRRLYHILQHIPAITSREKLHNHFLRVVLHDGRSLCSQTSAEHPRMSLQTASAALISIHALRKWQILFSCQFGTFSYPFQMRSLSISCRSVSQHELLHGLFTHFRNLGLSMDCELSSNHHPSPIHFSKLSQHLQCLQPLYSKPHPQ